ncbi:CotH kinase family protein [Micromonospora sonneratiae]|uniref:CotH kinase family protein n=1 Tax=Micromonospora sonneratiae TaxID=1184706 RepID=A0ABW3YBG4_9ACTN
MIRRLKHRVPVRLRHYWKLLVVCVAFLTVLTLVFGSGRVRPYVTSASDATGDEVTIDIAGGRDLFDASTAHSISLTFRDSDYQRMLDSYFDDGEKVYVEADLVVDGTAVPSVGIRLKGNSTLMGLTRDGKSRQSQGGAGPGGGRPGGGVRPEGGMPDGQPPGGNPPDGQPQTGDQPQTGGGPAGGGQRPGSGGPGRASLAAEEPEDLPWLISFDEFVEGRRYQGHQEIAVRVGGMGGGSTVLNEALALSLIDLAGEPAQRYAYSSFSVNDRPTTARLIVEHPDEHFADEFESPGVLYKSLSTSRFEYQGEDPVDYQDDFKQINKKGSQDLQPVINLIKWVTEASDEEFAARLADHVDVASFARYVALQNLLLNFDDMAGPGRNYYLWYDLGTKKFSVISWDHNLAFSGSATRGPHDAGTMGGPGGVGGPPGGMGAPPGGGAEQQPATGTPPQFPQGTMPGAGDDGAARPGGQGRQNGPMMGHELKERFLENSAFTEVYEDAYRELYQQLYGSGRALSVIDEVAAVLATVDGYQAETVAAEVKQMQTLIQQRTESLAGHEVITKG